MRTLLVTMLAVASVALSEGAAQQAANPVSVISAKRAKSYGTNSGEIKPRYEADIIIVVRATGLSLEEFRRVSRGGISVVAGDEELPPSTVLNGVIDGKPELKAVFVGPKAILDMRLVIGDYPAVPFKAEEEIADQLR